MLNLKSHAATCMVFLNVYGDSIIIYNWNIRRENQGPTLCPFNLHYCYSLIYMYVRRYIDWCNSTAQPILRFHPLFLSLSPLFHPCCPRHHCHFPSCFALTVKVTLHCCVVRSFVHLSCLENNAESLIIIVDLNYMLPFIVNWKWKGVSGRVRYYHCAIHYPSTPTLVFFPVICIM